MPASEEFGISQIVWSPVAMGMLTGKYRPGKPVPEGSRATHATDTVGGNVIQRFLNDEVLTAVQRFVPIADQVGLT